jgi:hypothetical protein
VDTPNSQLRPSHGIQPRDLRHPLGKLRGQTLRLLTKRLVVVLGIFRTDISAQRENVVMLGNLGPLHRAAEAGLTSTTSSSTIALRIRSAAENTKRPLESGLEY